MKKNTQKRKFCVVQINTLGKTLSTGRTTRELHNYLTEHEFESYIACPTSLDCNDAFFFSSRFQMKLDAFFTMLTGKEGYSSLIATYKLVGFLKKKKPDIVHLRVLHSNYINLKILFRYLSKHHISTVITLHDFWFLTGKCCFYSNLHCNKWINGCHDCSMPCPKNRPLLFERSKYMWNKKYELIQSLEKLCFVGVSDWTANEARKSRIAKGKKICTIYNWIDLNIFAPHNASYLLEKYSIKNKKIILGVSTYWNMGDRKGLDYYLELANIVSDNIIILLIGTIDNAVNIPNNVLSVGPINDPLVLSDFYNAADVYLNLSTEETFGKVSAESLACGTPVVAVDATVNKELVPSNCGIVFSKLSLDDIKKSLNLFFEKGKSFYSMNCRKHAEELFDMETNIKKYIDLYKSF